MISIRVFLPCQIIDSYIYAGHLFSVFTDGTLRVLRLEKLIENLPEDLAPILEFAFIRNDWLLNEQALSYYKVPEQLLNFKNKWKSVGDISLNIQEMDWKVLNEISSMPVYDLRGYARRIYWTNRDGVFEQNLEGSLDSNNRTTNKVAKIFDARTIYITAKSGELMLSADEEGLFHATLWTEEGSTLVDQTAYAPKSLRTGWSGLDLLNYEKNSSFKYYVNKVISEESRPFRYSDSDEVPTRRHIERIGIIQIQAEEMGLPELIRPNHVTYCFNSTDSTFWLLESGKFFKVNLRKEPEKPVHLSSNMYQIFDFSNNGNLPYSASMFAYGSVIEFFNKVVLTRDNRAILLEDEPAISVRTFPTSKRYRRLICITREDGIAFHSIFPSDKELAQAARNKKRRSKFDFP